MIKVSFQYDSSDPEASAFFNWISAFPLETTSIRLNTSIDVIESNGKGNDQNTHHIGNIVLESRKDDINQRGNSGIKGMFSGGWLSGIGKRKPITPQSETSLNVTPPVTKDAPAVKAADQMFEKTEAFKPEIPVSVNADNDSAFDSDMDDFLLNDVLFNDAEEFADGSENNMASVVESNVETFSASLSIGDDFDTSQSFDGGDSDTLDFLLGALDEFNQD